MPYPPRITVLLKAFQANPTRGAQLLRSGLTKDAGNTPLYGPACPGWTGVTAVKVGAASRFTSWLFPSVNGLRYSYLSPKFRVTLEPIRQSSLTYRSQPFSANE